MLGIAVTGLGRATPKTLAIFVWLYCIAWWFVQDVAKVLAYYYMKKYNVFGINDTSLVHTRSHGRDIEVEDRLIDEEIPSDEFSRKETRNPLLQDM